MCGGRAVESLSLIDCGAVCFFPPLFTRATLPLFLSECKGRARDSEDAVSAFAAAAAIAVRRGDAVLVERKDRSRVADVPEHNPRLQPSSKRVHALPPHVPRKCRRTACARGHCRGEEKDRRGG